MGTSSGRRDRFSLSRREENQISNRDDDRDDKCRQHVSDHALMAFLFGIAHGRQNNQKQECSKRLPSSDPHDCHRPNADAQRDFIAIRAPRSTSTPRRSPNVENLREFASSTNGDQWFLGVDAATNREVVVHRGNPSSGGHETTTNVNSFLNQRPFGPEHRALDLLLADRRAAESEETPNKPV
jgi:hypothetical protein